MNNKIYYICLISVLFAIYILCFSLAKDGYGYPGHNGFRARHSVWYHARHNYSYGASIRENSLSGSRFSRRGISGGK